MTSQPVQRAAPDGAIRLHRKFDDYIGAIYRIALGRPGDHDVFRDAIVRGSDFIAPVLILLALHIGHSLAAAPAARRAMEISTRNAAIILSVLAAGVLLRLAVTVAVTWGLGKMLATPERVLPGLIGYVWTQAALIAPGILLIRLGLTPHAPWWSIALDVAATFAIAVWFPAKVMRVAFGLPGIRSAILITLTGSVVSYLVDYLVAAVWM